LSSITLGGSITVRPLKPPVGARLGSGQRGEVAAVGLCRRGESIDECLGEDLVQRRDGGAGQLRDAAGSDIRFFDCAAHVDRGGDADGWRHLDLDLWVVAATVAVQVSAGPQGDASRQRHLEVAALNLADDTRRA
jgi:hypothetical protein